MIPPPLAAAAAALADLLARENAALAALDLPRATVLLQQKSQAFAAFEREVLRARPAFDPSDAERADWRRLGDTLRGLGEENRRLLERAIAVQGRVLASIARAVPKALAGAAPRYGAGGGLRPAARVPAIALSARA